MSIYQYRALKPSGEVIEGQLDAGSRGELLKGLGSKGLKVLSAEEVTATVKKQPKLAKKEKTGSSDQGGAENRLNSRQLIQFTEELSDLISAGVQLDTALNSIGSRSESKQIALVANYSYERVRDGVPLATALRQASPSFNELYCNLVSAGEASGSLGEILNRQVGYLTTLADLKGKLATALIYPAFLVVSGIGVGAMFIFFLLPKLQRLVESTGGELPIIARLMVGTGDFLRDYWIVLIALLALLLIAGTILFQRPSVKYWWDEVKLRIPLLGKLLLTRFNVQFVETLSNLLTNGLPLVKALELVEGTTPNRYIRDQILGITDKVSEGALLNRSMEKAGVFEPGLVDMVRIGEDTGQLASSMSKAGLRLDREFSRSIERVASVIQPAIILVMSVLVGTMAYMMISVIYETISVLRNR
tara:strand:+ start:662 stop:1915 length:1254 start_codon:yes stop_codon:yes gene_type:complete